MGMALVDRRKMKQDAQLMIDLARNCPYYAACWIILGWAAAVSGHRTCPNVDPKIVIMDEPTAALAVREVQGVLDLIRQLKSRGIGAILISHRLNDVLAVTDRIVVLRQGRAVADLATKETKMPDIVSAIVGGGDMLPLLTKHKVKPHG